MGILEEDNKPKIWGRKGSCGKRNMLFKCGSKYKKLRSTCYFEIKGFYFSDNDNLLLKAKREAIGPIGGKK